MLFLYVSEIICEVAISKFKKSYKGVKHSLVWNQDDQKILRARRSAKSIHSTVPTVELHSRAAPTVEAHQ